MLIRWFPTSFSDLNQTLHNTTIWQVAKRGRAFNFFFEGIGKANREINNDWCLNCRSTLTERRWNFRKTFFRYFWKRIFDKLRSINNVIHVQQSVRGVDESDCLASYESQPKFLRKPPFKGSWGLFFFLYQNQTYIHYLYVYFQNYLTF